jgi:hypothetical protein
MEDKKWQELVALANAGELEKVREFIAKEKAELKKELKT